MPVSHKAIFSWVGKQKTKLSVCWRSISGISSLISLFIQQVPTLINVKQWHPKLHMSSLLYCVCVFWSPLLQKTLLPKDDVDVGNENEVLSAVSLACFEGFFASLCEPVATYYAKRAWCVRTSCSNNISIRLLILSLRCRFRLMETVGSSLSSSYHLAFSPFWRSSPPLLYKYLLACFFFFTTISHN